MTRTEVLKDSPPMFESRWLDACSRVHPSVPVILFAPAIAILLTVGFERLSPGGVVAWAVGGYVFWTLTEYWLHRIVFHFEPEKGIGARLHWIIHGVHHDHPNDKMRLVMPPSVSIPLAALFFLGFWLILGNAAFPAFGGFMLGYLGYDYTHYYLHHVVPKTRLGKKLREQHMRHHFQDHRYGYGVSSPTWDVVFRTLPKKRNR